MPAKPARPASPRRSPPEAPASQTAAGGELHQQVQHRGNDRDAAAHLTDNHGHRVADNQNSLRAGRRGPTLLEDFLLREKIFHFDHERIPERIVHARGSAAHGVFECTLAVPELTQAAPLQQKGLQTPVFVRFSTVAGGAGSVDTPRDVRGFAVKFYTEAGNWDLVGNNIPVFFIQDAIKFPDLIHAVKMEADRGYPQAGSAHDTFWDFASLMPESLHMLMWAMSDRTLPRSLRMMQGFGVHTFRLVNAQGESRFVKFHWKPLLGLASTTWDEACKIAGADPDFHRRDLFESIARGDFPQWELGLQVFDEAWAERQPYDVLDATKLIPEEEIPVQVVGRMTLNRNVSNFFAETEQVAFLPSNLIPGIDFSNDPLLQGRLFSYLDTQKSRLGSTNFHQLPINAPRCPVHNFQRDGMMQTQIPQGRANYEPNSLAEAGEPGGPRECPRSGFQTFAASGATDGEQKLRVRAERFADHASQARLFWQSQTEVEQAHIASSFVFELSKVTLETVRSRMLAQLRNVDEALASRVATGLGQALPPAAPLAREPVALKPSPALSMLKQAPGGWAGRHVALLFDEGSNKASIGELKRDIEAKGARVSLVAPRVGETPVRGGKLKADAPLAGAPSVLFDAVLAVLPLSAVERLQRDVGVLQWFMDAHAHCKTIGYCQATEQLLQRVGIAAGDGVVPLDQFLATGIDRHWAREPKLRALA